MILESKYDIGDIVYSVGSSINVHEVIQITSYSWIPNDSDLISTDFSYNVIEVSDIGSTDTCNYSGIAEPRLYPTKQKAGEAWMARNGLDCGLRQQEETE